MAGLATLWLLVAGVLLAISAGIWAYYHFEKKRRLAFEALARRRGWTYAQHDDRRRQDLYKGFRPFGVGNRRRVRHVLVGRQGSLPFEAFEYEFTVQSGKSSHTETYAVASCPMPWPSEPLSIERENIGHKLFDALGGEDIDFESDEFSRAFWVRCPDRRAAYDVLHPGMMEFLLANRDAGAWQWRGPTMVLHRRVRWRPEGAEAFVATLAGFVERLPRHRLADAGQRPAAPSAGPRRSPSKQ